MAIVNCFHSMKFNQFLISGGSAAISVEDLRSNTSYLGGYTSVDRNIARYTLPAALFKVLIFRCPDFGPLFMK